MMDARPARPRWLRQAPWLWLIALLPAVAMVWLARDAVMTLLDSDETWGRIRSTRVLRVGVDASYPPFEWVEKDGTFLGYDIALATALAAKWQVSPQFVNVHFDGLYDALATRKFDLIISALPYDRTMTREVLYSHSYYNAGQVLVVNSGSQVHSLSQLAGMRAAVELGSEAHQLLRRLVRDEGLSVEIVAVRTIDEAANTLHAEQVDALVCDRVTAYELSGSLGNLELVDPPLTDEAFVIATRVDSPDLMREIDVAIAAWRDDGFLAALQERWLQAAGVAVSGP